jgi:hypothetical protein
VETENDAKRGGVGTQVVQQGEHVMGAVVKEQGRERVHDKEDGARRGVGG